jgi:uncharacterized protein (DUF4213/DUF364 family)
MPILDDLFASVIDDTPVQDLLIGLHWTAVCSKQMGLASTLNSTSCCSADDLPNGGHLHEQPARELAALVFSSRPLEVSIGMAALNSLLPITPLAELNAKDLLLARGAGKNVAVIGHFPFTEALRDVAAQLWVLELDPQPGDWPAEAAPDLLPQASVIGLTANTLMNGTFDTLHKLFPPDALVIMMGPSTPMSPVLFDYGITVLAGSQVTDPLAVLRQVGQASPLRRANGLRRCTMMIRES